MLPQRIEDKIEKGDCWLWTGAIGSGGYAMLWWEGTTTTAHRVVYSLLREPVPDEMEVDHLCENRACVNPDHMRVCSPRDNTLRSNRAPGALNARKTHCPRGHPYDEENTMRRPDGRRRCRTCERDWSREYQRRRRAGR